MITTIILSYALVPHYTIAEEQVAKIIRFTHILVYNNDSIRAILGKFLMHIHFAATVAVGTQKIRVLQCSRENIWSDCEIEFNNYDGGV